MPHQSQSECHNKFSGIILVLYTPYDNVNYLQYQPTNSAIRDMQHSAKLGQYPAYQIMYEYKNA